MSNDKLKEMIENNSLVKLYTKKTNPNITFEDFEKKYPYISKKSLKLLNEYEDKITELTERVGNFCDNEIIKSMNIPGDSLISYYYKNLFIKSNTKISVQYEYIEMWSGKNDLSIRMNCVKQQNIKDERMLLEIVNKNNKNEIKFIHEGNWLDTLNSMIQSDLETYKECEGALMLYMGIKDKIGSSYSLEEILNDYDNFDNLFKN